MSRRRPPPGRAGRPTGPASVRVVVLALLLTGLAAMAAVAGPAPGARATSRTGDTSAPSGPTATVPPAPAAGAVTTRPGPVVLVGIDAAAWTEVDVAPGPPATGPVGAGPAGPLSDLATRGSVASLSVRSGETPTCPVDGWLTVSAGRRAVGPGRGPGGRCPAIPGVVIDPTSVPVTPDAVSGVPDPRAAGRVAGWTGLRDRNAHSPFAAVLGTLSDAVSGARSCVTAVGPGAALAAAGPAGDVDSYVADPRLVTRDVLTGCAVTIVDAGRSVAAAAPVLARIASLLPTGSTLLVVGIDDAPVGGTGTGGLRVAAATGPAFPGSTAPSGASGSPDWTISSGTPAGRLSSGSTRWPGLVQATDIAPTLLVAAGVTARPATFVGSAWTATSAASPTSTVAGLRTDALRARVAQHAIPVFYTAFGTAAGLLALLVLALGRWAPARRGSAVRGSGVVRGWGLVVAAAPVSTRLASLVPWWSSSRPGAALAVTVTGWALAVALVSVLVAHLSTGSLWWPARGTGAWGPAALGVAALTVLVVGADLVAGSPLQKLTVIGLTPVQGGRFYGMGNELFAATGACALACVAALATRWPDRAVAWCAAVGTGFVLLDGLPGLGADFGGVPAAVVGFGVAGLALSPVRPRAGRLLAVAGAAVAVAVLAVLLDLSRAPGSRTQVGDFAADVLGGGGGDVVSRKATAAAGPFLYRIDSPLGSTAAWVGLAGLALMAAVVVRPRLVAGTAVDRLLSARPQVRAVLLGAVCLGVVGGLLNDSGIAVPVVVAEVGVGLLVAVLPGAPGLPGALVLPGAELVTDRVTDQQHRSGDVDEAGTDARAPAADGWESL